MKPLPPTEKQIRFVRKIQDMLLCGEPSDKELKACPCCGAYVKEVK